ncbi:MAG: RagB/SusD family nutrient uptake outer membrane protein [Rhodothermales bacterium]
MTTQRNIKRRLRGRTASGSFLILIAALVLASCDDFLNEPPRGTLSGPVLATRAGVDALLIGAYSGLSPGGDDWGASVIGNALWEAAPDNWVYGDVMGGDAKKGSDASDQPPINPLQRGNVEPTNGFLNTQWRIKYDGIARVNELLRLLELVPEGEMSAQDRANIEGQARFLRGHHYFELRRQFGMVPWIDETTADYNVPNDVDIWPMIEADFQFGYDNMYETQEERARANKWAAGAYLGKTYLYQEKWDEARDVFTTVINEGQTTDGQPYDLVENYADLFFPEAQYNSENVFMIQFSAAPSVTNGLQNARLGSMLNYPYNSPFRCCGFYQPSQDLVNHFQTVDGLPPVGNHNATMVASDQGVASDEDFVPHDGTLDPRLDWAVGRRGVPYLDWGPHPGNRWVRDQTYAGPYAPKKHIYRRANPEHANQNQWAPGSAVNYHVIRFADVLLMAAEAEAELGNAEQARQYVNRVRARAANPDGWVSNSHNEDFAVAVVDNEADMLASGAILNEWVVRTDRNSTFMLIRGGEDAATNIDNWVEYPEPNYEIVEYSAAEFGSGDAAIDKIRYERKMELAMEGHRLFDLLRWDIAPQAMNAYYAYEGQHALDVRGGQWRMPGQVFPIPQAQIDLSLGRLEQNPGY